MPTITNKITHNASDAMELIPQIMPREPEAVSEENKEGVFYRVTSSMVQRILMELLSGVTERCQSISGIYLNEDGNLLSISDFNTAVNKIKIFLSDNDALLPPEVKEKLESGLNTIDRTFDFYNKSRQIFLSSGENPKVYLELLSDFIENYGKYMPESLMEKMEQLKFIFDEVSKFYSASLLMCEELSQIDKEGQGYASKIKSTFAFVRKNEQFLPESLIESLNSGEEVLDRVRVYYERISNFSMELGNLYYSDSGFIDKIRRIIELCRKNSEFFNVSSSMVSAPFKRYFDVLGGINKFVISLEDIYYALKESDYAYSISLFDNFLIDNDLFSEERKKALEFVEYYRKLNQAYKELSNIYNGGGSSSEKIKKLCESLISNSTIFPEMLVLFFKETYKIYNELADTNDDGYKIAAKRFANAINKYKVNEYLPLEIKDNVDDILKILAFILDNISLVTKYREMSIDDYIRKLSDLGSLNKALLGVFEPLVELGENLSEVLEHSKLQYEKYPKSGSYGEVIEWVFGCFNNKVVMQYAEIKLPEKYKYALLSAYSIHNKAQKFPRDRHFIYQLRWLLEQLCSPEVVSLLGRLGVTSKPKEWLEKQFGKENFSFIADGFFALFGEYSWYEKIKLLIRSGSAAAFQILSEFTRQWSETHPLVMFIIERTKTYIANIPEGMGRIEALQGMAKKLKDEIMLEPGLLVKEEAGLFTEEEIANTINAINVFTINENAGTQEFLEYLVANSSMFSELEPLRKIYQSMINLYIGYAVVEIMHIPDDTHTAKIANLKRIMKKLPKDNQFNITAITSLLPIIPPLISAYRKTGAKKIKCNSWLDWLCQISDALIDRKDPQTRHVLRNVERWAEEWLSGVINNLIESILGKAFTNVLKLNPEIEYGTLKEESSIGSVSPNMRLLTDNNTSPEGAARYYIIEQGKYYKVKYDGIEKVWLLVHPEESYLQGPIGREIVVRIRDRWRIKKEEGRGGGIFDKGLFSFFWGGNEELEPENDENILINTSTLFNDQNNSALRYLLGVVIATLSIGIMVYFYRRRTTSSQNLDERTTHTKTEARNLLLRENNDKAGDVVISVTEPSGNAIVDGGQPLVSGGACRDTVSEGTEENLGNGDNVRIKQTLQQNRIPIMLSALTMLIGAAAGYALYRYRAKNEALLDDAAISELDAILSHREYIFLSESSSVAANKTKRSVSTSDTDILDKLKANAFPLPRIAAEATEQLSEFIEKCFNYQAAYKPKNDDFSLAVDVGVGKNIGLYYSSNKEDIYLFLNGHFWIASFLVHNIAFVGDRLECKLFFPDSSSKYIEIFYSKKTDKWAFTERFAYPDCPEIDYRDSNRHITPKLSSEIKLIKSGWRGFYMYNYQNIDKSAVRDGCIYVENNEDKKDYYIGIENEPMPINIIGPNLISILSPEKESVLYIHYHAGEWSAMNEFVTYPMPRESSVGIDLENYISKNIDPRVSYKPSYKSFPTKIEELNLYGKNKSSEYFYIYIADHYWRFEPNKGVLTEGDLVLNFDGDIRKIPIKYNGKWEFSSPEYTKQHLPEYERSVTKK